MSLERAVKFGLITALVVAFVTLATGWLMWTEYTTTIAGREPAWSLIVMIGVAGLTVNMIFLFMVIGEYVDRELETRGLANTEK